MQAFSELTGGELVWTVGLVHEARHEQAGQQFDLLKAPLGDGMAMSDEDRGVAAVLPIVPTGVA
jgi:hypothetical protein